MKTEKVEVLKTTLYPFADTGIMADISPGSTSRSAIGNTWLHVRQLRLDEKAE